MFCYLFENVAFLPFLIKLRSLSLKCFFKSNVKKTIITISFVEVHRMLSKAFNKKLGYLSKSLFDEKEILCLVIKTKKSVSSGSKFTRKVEMKT